MTAPRPRGGRLISIAALAVLAAIALAAAGKAAAAPPPPLDLHVLDGEGWHPRNGFSLRWTNPPSNPPIASIHYRVRSPLGTIVVGPEETAGGLHAIDGIWVPNAPGAYSAEVWLEDSAGAEGAPADTWLRFDASRPGAVVPQQPGGWISRNELPLTIPISHPIGPSPPSGIRGYAVAVDRTAAASPCIAADLCTEAETDLRGGLGDSSYTVEELPEGTSYVHALAVSGSQVRSAEVGQATLHVDRTDPQTSLLGAPQGWTNHSVELEALATDSGSGMAPLGDGEPFTAIQVDDGPPVVAAGNRAKAKVIADGAHTISHYARDAAGNVADGADANGRPNAAPETAQVRIDRDPPTVAFTGSADPDEPELIEARVADGLSGPDPARGVIAVRAAGSGDPYEPLPTVGAGETLIARWTSDSYPVGEYEFRVTGFDRAGNSAVSSERANGAAMLLPNPLKARSVLLAGLGGTFAPRRRERTVAFGRAAQLRGRLSATSDTPLGGRSITVVERFDPGASEARRTTTVPTSESGRFQVRLAPGASREVFAVFGGTGTATGTASRPLRLAVRSRVRLRTSSALARIGGRPIVFRGRVAAGPGELPPGGATVELQFRAAGLPWSEFRSVVANRRGRFRYAYRFSDNDSRGIRFRFRAFVPAQSDWPYEPGGSSPVAVRGR